MTSGGPPLRPRGQEHLLQAGEAIFIPALSSSPSPTVKASSGFKAPLTQYGPALGFPGLCSTDLWNCLLGGLLEGTCLPSLLPRPGLPCTCTPSLPFSLGSLLFTTGGKVCFPRCAEESLALISCHGEGPSQSPGCHPGLQRLLKAAPCLHRHPEAQL